MICLLEESNRAITNISLTPGILELVLNETLVFLFHLPSFLNRYFDLKTSLQRGSHHYYRIRKNSKTLLQKVSSSDYYHVRDNKILEFQGHLFLEALRLVRFCLVDILEALQLWYLLNSWESLLIFLELWILGNSGIHNRWNFLEGFLEIFARFTTFEIFNYNLTWTWKCDTRTCAPAVLILFGQVTSFFVWLEKKHEWNLLTHCSVLFLVK